MCGKARICPRFLATFGEELLKSCCLVGVVVFPPKPFLGLENKSVWETCIYLFVCLVGWYYLCFFLGGLAERPPSPGSLPAFPLPSSTLQAVSTLPCPPLAVALLVLQDLPFVLPAPTAIYGKVPFPYQTCRALGYALGAFLCILPALCPIPCGDSGQLGTDK